MSCGSPASPTKRDTLLSKSIRTAIVSAADSARPTAPIWQFVCPLREEELLKERPIGVFDSGLGGLAVAREVLDEMPGEDIVYFADFANLPYGPKRPEQVKGFVLKVMDFFLERRVKAVLIGCNTASAAAEGAAQDKAPGIPVIGMIRPAVEAALRQPQIRRVGVVGTMGTIESKVYEHVFQQLSPSTEVFGNACPELLRLAEQGDISDKEKLRQLATSCIEPLEEKGIDVLILGCTDFTCVVDDLLAVLSPSIRIVDPAGEVATKANLILGSKDWRRTGAETGTMTFFASDKAPTGAKDFAERVFDIHIDELCLVPPK